MATKLIRLIHKIAVQLHLAAESSTICSSLSRRPVRDLLDTPSQLSMVASLTDLCNRSQGIWTGYQLSSLVEETFFSSPSLGSIEPLIE
jgi:hypothetical protein